MKTVARTVENDSIHLYLQRRYVNNPAKSAKKEYHRRVSPIVLKGGLSRSIHKRAMKVAITTRADEAKKTAKARRRRYRRDDSAQCSLAAAENAAPDSERTTADMPNHIKLSQKPISALLSISFARPSHKKQQSPSQHHNNAGNCCIFPRLAYNLQYTSR